MSQPRRSWIHWLFRRVILGGPVRLLTCARVEGWENLPKGGGFIIAANHQTYFDPIVLGVYLGRYELHFLAKASLWNPRGFLRIFRGPMRWFMNNAQAIPTRGDTQVNQQSLSAGSREVNEGEVLGIFPEGTRARDGYVHKGRTGIARIAFETGAPVVLVAIRNAGSWWHRTVLVIDTPIQVARSPTRSSEAERQLTDRIMKRLAELSERPYKDEYIVRKASS